MAKELLNGVLNGIISWESFVIWLNCNEKNFQGVSDEVQCSKGDFVIYFINLLHDDAASKLQRNNGNAAEKTTENKNCSSNRKRVQLHLGRTKESEKTHNNTVKCDNLNKSNVCRSPQNCTLGTYFCNNKFVDCKKSPGPSGTSNGLVGGRRILLGNSKLTPEKSLDSSSAFDRSNNDAFLSNCPLSPILDGIISPQPNRNGLHSSEINSSNHRAFQKDARRHSTNRQSTPAKTSSPCSSEFNISEHSFPVVGSPVQTNTSRRRRIKPTRLTDSFEKGAMTNTTAGHSFGEIMRSSEPSTPFKGQEVSPNESKAADFRSLLLVEKQKLQNPPKVCSSVVKNVPVVPLVVAKPESVSNVDQLRTLSSIYSMLIDANLICNIITELHFVFSLLSVQETQNEANEKKDYSAYFKSVHECVFFACAVLNHQRKLLCSFDKASLKMLFESDRLSSFTPDLCQFLHEIYESQAPAKKIFSGAKQFSGNICFQPDKDNRENFPSDQAFATFRKQRDGFYEILKVWEDNHLLPEWSLQVALGTRVRNLINLIDEPANFIHFARLFRSQLLGSCQRTSTIMEEELDNDTLEVLKSLKEGNPDKYSKLFDRLVAPVKSTNPCVLPEFPAHQEFYRDFIVCASHASFNHHLIDSFMYEILNLESSPFTTAEVDDEVLSVDEKTTQSFVLTVQKLQLMAKFLGFVVFLPYRTRSKITEPLSAEQLSLRTKMKPQLDVLAFLEEALKSKKLILTVPWTVQYLAMIDGVSLHLSYYKSVMQVLFCVYRSLPSATHLGAYGRMLLQISIGWLFELPQFPQDLFYTWFLSGDFCDTNENKLPQTSSSGTPKAIDELNFIDCESLQILCPSLETIKWLLLYDMNHVGNVGATRHITPVPVTSNDSSSLPTTCNLQIQLEENFFECHPKSMRRTVEFVAERIASSCVKHVCNKLLQNIKERSHGQLRENFDPENKDAANSKVASEATQCSEELKRCCQESVPAYCHEKCSAVLPLLLAEDVAEEVTKICVDIAVRMCVDTVNKWINSHITPSLFAKDLQAGIDRLFRNTVTRIVKNTNVLSEWRCVPEKASALSPADAIATVRKLLWQITKHEDIQFEDVENVLSIISDTLQYRKDLVPSAERVLSTLSVDLALLIVARKPSLFTERLLDSFSTVWKIPEVVTSESFSRVICSRNVMLLMHSSEISKTWSATAQFLSFLLKNDLLTATALEEQCVSLLQQEWPQDILNHISSCFGEVVKVYHTDNKDTYDSFSLLMELLSELCKGMEDLDS